MHHRATLSATTLAFMLALAACAPKDEGTAGDTDATTEGSSSSDSGTTSASGNSDGSGATSAADTGDISTATGSSSVSSTSSSTSSSTGDPTTGDPPAACKGEAEGISDLVTAMAYTKAQIPPDMTTGGGSSGSSGGSEPDPNTLYIRLSSQSFVCKDPTANLDCGPEWAVTIIIPPEYQTPGIHNLAFGDVFGVMTETGPDEGNNECFFGGGSFSATFELIAIDDTTVEGRLCDVDVPFDANVEGWFVADRCP